MWSWPDPFRARSRLIWQLGRPSKHTAHMPTYIVTFWIGCLHQCGQNWTKPSSDDLRLLIVSDKVVLDLGGAGDVGYEFGQVHIAGPPCIDYSSMGLKRGTNGPTAALFLTWVHALRTQRLKKSISLYERRHEKINKQFKKNVEKNVKIM